MNKNRENKNQTQASKPKIELNGEKLRIMCSISFGRPRKASNNQERTIIVQLKNKRKSIKLVT